MPLHVEVVSPETVLYSGEGDMVVCRTADGAHRVPARPRAVHRRARRRQGAGDPARTGRAGDRGARRVRRGGQRQGHRALRRRRAARADRRRPRRGRRRARARPRSRPNDERRGRRRRARARGAPPRRRRAPPPPRGRWRPRSTRPFRTGARQTSERTVAASSIVAPDAFSSAIAQPASIASRSIDVVERARQQDHRQLGPIGLDPRVASIPVPSGRR